VPGENERAARRTDPGPWPRVQLATDQGAAERPNEDFAAVAPGAAVLLDGAGYPLDQDTGCRHGVAWYARTLGGLLVAGACDGEVPLRELLGRGIEQVAGMHAGTCDLRHPFTPTATVIIVRQRGGVLEYLVLCDSVLLLVPRHGAPRAITDTRLEDLAARLRPPDDLRAGTPEHTAAWQARNRQIQASRNQPGGFWSAGADPVAAQYALTGVETVSGLSAVALLSDGASRLADLYGMATWAGICAILATQGPAGLIARVRTAEAGDPRGRRWPRGKINDDATVIYWQAGE
jgi:hypothetical protein